MWIMHIISLNTVTIVGHEWICNKTALKESYTLIIRRNCRYKIRLIAMWFHLNRCFKKAMDSYLNEQHNGIYVPLSLYLTYSSSRLVWPYSMSHLVFTQNVHVWQCFHHKSKLGHTYNLHITSTAMRVLKHTCTWSMFSYAALLFDA